MNQHYINESLEKTYREIYALKIMDWCRERSFINENLFIKKLRTKFTDEQIIFIIETLYNTCLKCFNSEHPCYCERDE